MVMKKLSFSSPFRGSSGGGAPDKERFRTPESPPPNLPPFRVEEKIRLYSVARRRPFLE
jgi:hypothetical protein